MCKDDHGELAGTGVREACERVEAAAGGQGKGRESCAGVVTVEMGKDMESKGSEEARVAGLVACVMYSLHPTALRPEASPLPAFPATAPSKHFQSQVLEAPSGTSLPSMSLATTTCQQLLCLPHLSLCPADCTSPLRCLKGCLILPQDLPCGLSSQLLKPKVQESWQMSSASFSSLNHGDF